MSETAVPDRANGNGTVAPKKPAVLIIGGLGYIGRFLTHYIYTNNLASELRIVDKQLPELAWLGPELVEACSRERFMQADASREQSLPRIFTPTTSPQYTLVINCGGETRLSQPDTTYQLRSHTLSLNLGRECASRRIPMIELSTGQVYKPSRNPCSETAKLKPWHKLAKWKLTAEQDLAKISGLEVVVLRLANVYGRYVWRGLGTACCMARVCETEGREMRWLWEGGLRVNTVEVGDVCRAVWRAGEWLSEETAARRRKDPSFTAIRPVPTFNIVDHGDTSQNTLASLLSSYFNITTTFPSNSLTSSLVHLYLDSVLEDVNDETLDPWAELLETSSNNNITAPATNNIPSANTSPDTITEQNNTTPSNSNPSNAHPSPNNNITTPSPPPSSSTPAHNSESQPPEKPRPTPQSTRGGPLTPYLEKEALLDKDLCMDGSLFERTTGFRYQRERLGEGTIGELVDSWRGVGWWP